MQKEKHDLVILGAGPAGLSAAIYASRYKMDFVLLGKSPGGNMCESYNVENYPGLEDVIPGHDLADKMIAQLERFGHRTKMEEIQSITKSSSGFKLVGLNTEYQCKTLLLATGMERNRLNIPGEAEFEGRGVAYCATCDGFFYKEKTVAVIGGGDSAVTAALYLADICEKVYLIARASELRAQPAHQERARENKKIEIMMNTKLKEIVGHDKVEKVVLDNGTELNLDGVFIECGQVPQTILFKTLNLKTDSNGVIIVKNNQRTSARRVWAAGDITTNSNGLRQIITAASEGAVAVVDIFTELKKIK